jgi:SAM-dependent methyltransferase
VNSQWHDEASRIYQGYVIYHQSGGAEQPVFVQGNNQPSPRSEVIARQLQSSGLLPKTGKLLDFGCGNGAFIRACSQQWSQWSFFGAELGKTHEHTVRGIAGVQDFFSGPLDTIPGQYDVVSLIHVWEHISELPVFIQQLKAHLTPNGILLIEVPNCLANPFMLLVADHCSHNSPSVLRSILAKSGFEVRITATDWIPKEITLVCQLTTGIGNSGNQAVGPDESNQILNSCEWLHAIVKRVNALHGSFGLFGTSIAATWLDAQTSGKASFFVDEDPLRQGRKHMERPILAPKDIPNDTAIFIALPTPLAKAIAQRINKPGLRIFTPDQ